MPRRTTRRGAATSRSLLLLLGLFALRERSVDGAPVDPRNAVLSGSPAGDGPLRELASPAERALDGFVRGRGVSGPDGVLKRGRFLPGAYRLEVARGGRSSARNDVVLGDGGPVELEIGIDVE